MCGIAGWAGSSGMSRSALDQMLQVQDHRGPDGRGQWSDGRCALGHLRLAVIDPSELGCQPMADDGKRLQIVYNGEIYNFLELRRTLEKLGHRFHSGTDTEVVLHAYRQWGIDCLTRFRGMFAFGLWDSERRRLFLARDRVGKKPLFYSRVGSGVLFASELQGLLAHPEVDRAVDWRAIDSYLSWGYVPAPASGFAGVRKLPPGHWMTVDVTEGGPVVDVKRWWSLTYEPKLAISEREAVEQLRDRLREAVRLRLISDVPLGAFLSGGIDSSIVVGLMAQLSPEPVKTFSIGFDEADHNELAHAARIARLWGTDHHEQVVRPDALSVLPTLVRHYGEPYADSSALPTYYLSQMARSQVTVALNGDGGDESFAGYDRYRASAYAGSVARLPGGADLTAALASLVPDGADAKSQLRRVRRFLEAAHQPASERYGRWMSYFTDADKHVLYTGDLRHQLSGERPAAWMAALFSDASGLSPVDAAMSVDVRSYLPYDLLVKVDIASMAHSLEARSPLLDHDVMEFAARLPVRLKVRRGTSKHLLRRAFPEMLPAENVRRRKMGFAIPVGAWFRGPLRELLEDTLLASDARTGAYLDAAGVRALVDAHITRRRDSSGQIWTLLMLELWHREMVEAPSAS